MTFGILDKMVGLTVVNAVDGSVIGVSSRLIFGRKALDFKYILVEGNDDASHMIYLRYPDILRFNDKAILCLPDESPLTSNYVFYNDPDAFVFVGSEAVDEKGKMIGRIISAQLNEDAKVISFTVQQGAGKVEFDISRLLKITQSGVLIIHRTEDDVFVFEEEAPKEEIKETKAAEPVIEETVAAAEPVEETVVEETPAAAEEPEIAPAAVQEAPETVETPPAEEPKEEKRSEPEIQWNRPADSYSDSDSSYEEPQSDSRGNAAKPQSKGLSISAITSVDLVSGLRYAAMVAFFAACIIMHKLGA